MNDSSIIPFKLYGKLIAVEVLVNDMPCRFILDTGASETALNSYHISSKEISDSTSDRAYSESDMPHLTYHELKSFDFYGISAKNESFVAIDLGHVEISLGKTVHGLLGNDLMSDYHVFLDYRNSILRLIDSDNLDSFISEFFPESRTQAIPFELDKNVPVLIAEVLGQPIRCAIDTGSELNIVDSKKCDPLSGDVKKLRKGNLILAENKPFEVYSGVVPTLKLGEKEFKGVRTIFKDLDLLGNKKKLDHDGIIGYPILVRQPVIISYPKNEIIFL